MPASPSASASASASASTSATTPTKTSLSETNYILQIPSPLPITRKIEQLEMQFYQYKCFELIPALAGLNEKQIQNKFKEVLQTHGCCTILPSPSSAEKAAGVEERFMASFNGDMLEKLVSKDYVIRLGEDLTQHPERDNEKTVPVVPQFLRGIVTGGKLRLCGAFTEHTTFLY